MKLSRILSAVLCLSLVLGLSIPASANPINKSFKFSLGNTGTAFQPDKNGAKNKKTEADDPATVYCINNTAPGWGYYIHLRSTIGEIQTYSYWYNNTNRLRHPTYVDQANANQKYYTVWGRIDNDYDGTYTMTGEFNADYTTAP